MIIFMILAIAGLVATTGPGDYVSIGTQQKVYEAGSSRR